MPTLVCVPIMVETVERAIADAVLAGEHGADLVEYRIDELFSTLDDLPEVLRLVDGSPLPCIVTCRPTWEGGSYDGDEDERVAMFERLGTGDTPPRYIDAELAAYTRSANERMKIDLAVDHPGQRRDLRTRLILSSHDFSGRPTDLTRRVLGMQSEPAASVHKVAFRARSLRDNLELFDLLAQSPRPMIALGMGEFGLMSRVLARKFGGFLTFASLRDSSATAPGQPSLHDLLETYRFRSIGRRTRVYGIVGWPVGHSRSPLIHNAGFEEVGHDGVYVPLPIASGDDPETSYASLKATLLELIDHPSLDFAGCSVTLPHKENLVRLAGEQGWALDEVASASGSANTVVVERESGGRAASVRVANTDAAAATHGLERELGGLRDRRVLLLGAGGVARAIAFALAGAGAEVAVANRTASRAERLVADINARHPGTAATLAWAERDLASPDAIVHCTSVGMAGGPAPDDSPLGPDAFANLPASTVLLETVYAPVRTRLLSMARDAGWRILDGVEMFVEQGAKQFELWTGCPAPRERFARLVRDALNG
ncbi:MAG: type I 3-dehydroquinate dehydratase [Phycisphaerales bacterium JB041]